MRLARKLALTVGVAAAAGCLAFAPFEAHAGVQPVKYTDKSVSAVSGYYAQTFGTQDALSFTHVTSYLGSDGHSTIEQFTAATPPSPNIQGETFSGTPTNGGGVALCDSTTGEAAQVGDVYIGGGLMDVVLGYGDFTGAAVNNGDICENGIVPSDPVVLLPNVPVNDTVKVDLLFDGHHSHNGCHAGDVTADAQNLSQDGPVIGLGPDFCYSLPHGTQFNQADAGVVADTTSVSQLPGTVPLPDGNTDLLMRWAHIALNGNDLITGHEVHGTFQNSADWDITPVASTTNGDVPPGGTLLLGPGKFFDDHFSEFVGPGVA